MNVIFISTSLLPELDRKPNAIGQAITRITYEDMESAYVRSSTRSDRPNLSTYANIRGMIDSQYLHSSRRFSIQRNVLRLTALPKHRLPFAIYNLFFVLFLIFLSHFLFHFSLNICLPSILFFPNRVTAIAFSFPNSIFLSFCSPLKGLMTLPTTLT